MTFPTQCLCSSLKKIIIIDLYLDQATSKLPSLYRRVDAQIKDTDKLRKWAVLQNKQLDFHDKTMDGRIGQASSGLKTKQDKNLKKQV